METCLILITMTLFTVRIMATQQKINLNSNTNTVSALYTYAPPSDYFNDNLKTYLRVHRAYLCVSSNSSADYKYFVGNINIDVNTDGNIHAAE